MIDVLANDYDPDGDNLSIDSFTQGAAGTVADNGDGTVTYTPILDFVGDDSFQYTISDGDPTTLDATATVNVTVQAVPSTLEYTSTALPIKIGDLKTVSSSIDISGTGATIENLTVRINLTHALPSDLTAQLVSPDGSTLTIDGSILSGDYQYVVSGATGLTLDGTWTLQVTDNLKNRKRGSLIEWTMIVEPAPTEFAPSPAAAVDQALLAWVEPDSSDDDDSDILTETLVNDLALMLVE